MDERRVFILPGEIFFSEEPTEIATLLGSCVAVCLFNKVHKFGGMNHYMLPRAHDGAPTGKHGDYSTEMLIKMMLEKDANINNIEATVLGGGNVTGHLSLGTGIGANNIIVAREVLEKFKIRIARSSVGGDHGRKVYFKNWTGEIETRKIEKSAQTKVLEEKKKTYEGRKIKVLIVDDSKTVRSLIAAGLGQDPEIEIVGEAENPYEAREMLLETDPDVICLDIIMPRMDGITFLKKLFQYAPKPVIIISTVAQDGSKLREQALKIGAVDVVDKNSLNIYQGDELIRSLLTTKVKTAAKAWVKKKTKEELEGI